jgi:hypothetical protein
MRTVVDVKPFTCEHPCGTTMPGLRIRLLGHPGAVTPEGFVLLLQCGRCARWHPVPLHDVSIDPAAHASEPVAGTASYRTP